MRLAALLLAAGASRRFGSDKRLARLPSGDTLLVTAAAACLRVHDNCCVVLDRGDGPLQDELVAMGAAVIQVATRGESAGMGDSLAAGVRHIAAANYHGCLVSLADMPWVGDETRRAVARALAEHPLVVPAWQGQWGHPVGFQARFFPGLMDLSGDRGARSLLRQHAAQCHVLPVPDRGVVRDVDTPADLGRG
jgi:molybdenum cofactor cytidylyltransferase